LEQATLMELEVIQSFVVVDTSQEPKSRFRRHYQP
jgi:hypothetical protein